MCLLNVIGPYRKELFDTFTFTDAGDEHKIPKVCERFEAYCHPKQNELLERQAFHARKQQKGDSATQFLSALQKLAETCDFDTSLDTALRDQMVLCLIPNEKLQD